jgi:hypothetical protein
MSKKRAFVRYTKQGKLIPGSLIVTTNGDYPDKSATWKEVSTDLCCDDGEQCINLPLTFTTTIDGFPLESGCRGIVEFKCNGVKIWEIRPPVPAGASFEGFVDALNNNYGWVGIFSVIGRGETLRLEMNGDLTKVLCPIGELTMTCRVACIP